MARDSFRVLGGWAACLFLATALTAAEAKHHKGTVVSASSGKIVLKDEGGKEQSFQVESTAKVTKNGKPARLEEFEETMPVQVTTDDKGKVLAVSTIDIHKRAKVAAVRASADRFSNPGIVADAPRGLTHF